MSDEVKEREELSMYKIKNDKTRVIGTTIYPEESEY